jgi:hypothetical protein
MDQLFPGRTVERPAMPFMSRRQQTWLWLIFAGSILGSVYVHELGSIYATYPIYVRSM